MELNELIRKSCEWLRGTGPNSDIVTSSRIRLARNLNKIPFVHWANKRQEEEVLNTAKNAIQQIPFLKDSLFLRLNTINPLDRQFLIERHLISYEHAQNPDHKAVIIGEKEIISIMINEEDHLRIQVMHSGFNMQDAWKFADRIDKELEIKLEYAFSPEWGYLTACPTNTGTGLRGSCMLHLPCLVMTKQMGKIIHAISKLGLTVRGLYGEGTEASGNFFQISNQVTLGQKEDIILDNLERIIKQVLEHEQGARKSLFEQNKAILQDQIWRSYGTLKNAHIITTDETVELLSSVRLGIDIGIIKDITRQTINELFLLIQPAHLQKLEGKILNSNERDLRRAALIRERFKKK
ncbi:MAG: protein arginine kinase [Candidatus Omnitrophica bacterium]|nr:protein arginine kinase [Candidatus Omnitrophota bacterium]